MKTMIESPYAGDIARNVAYARACMADSFSRGEVPFASHLLYPGTLDDLIPEERKKGIEAGYAWGEHAEAVAFYTDLGWSTGMKAAWDRYVLMTKKVRDIHKRSLGDEAAVEAAIARFL